MMAVLGGGECSSAVAELMVQHVRKGVLTRLVVPVPLIGALLLSRGRSEVVPLRYIGWYDYCMNTTYYAPLGDRGRLVVPSELRARQGWKQGDPLLFIETPEGVVLMTRSQATASLRRQLAGGSLVEELLAERRAAAAQEDIA